MSLKLATVSAEFVSTEVLPANEVLSPKIVSPNIHELIEQAKMAVRAKTGSRILGLQVRIDDGCLILTGRASSYYLKQLATHAVREAVVDLSVQNDVEVG